MTPRGFFTILADALLLIFALATCWFLAIVLWEAL